MTTWKNIVEMTRTPQQRIDLENLTDKEKLALVLELTDSKTFVGVLEFIQQAEEDADYCQSYR